MKRLISVCVALVAVSQLCAEDVVTYRDRSKGERQLQTAKGDITSESLAEIKVGARVIPTVDIIDVQYDVPGLARLDYPNAVSAESARHYDDAIREYRGLLGKSVISKSPKLQRHFDYKIAMLSVAKSDSAGDWRTATDALLKFISDHPEGWQRVHATRLLARLYLDQDPPQVEPARKAYEELAANPSATPELKAECGFAVVDTFLQSGQFDKARERLAKISANDLRLEWYRLACQAMPDQPGAAIQALETALTKADENQKATIYNLLGNCYRLDPKRQTDAILSYLWVEVIYNQDPVELAKAQSRLAELFHERKDEKRAAIYREKVHGR
ncbi:MAG: tetratricopeptide repeat protein [Gemmataceae bacterium]